MALIVEDGTGLANAESYISLAEADAYHTSRGNLPWINDADMTETAKEQALRRATDYLQHFYSGLWLGYKSTLTQALDWPRQDVPKVDTPYGNYYLLTEIPQELKNACAELAYKAAQGDLTPDLTQAVKREKIDVLEVEYSEFSPQSKRYRVIDNLLSKFLAQSSSGIFRKLAR
jgi:hypothetical protein